MPIFYIRMDKSTITNTRKIQTIKGNTNSKECQSKCMWEFRIEFKLGRNGEDISLRTQCMAVDAQWEVHGCSMDGWRLLLGSPQGLHAPVWFEVPSLLALLPPSACVTKYKVMINRSDGPPQPTCWIRCPKFKSQCVNVGCHSSKRGLLILPAVRKV